MLFQSDKEMTMSKLPSKIFPCPIKEAVFEMRFASDLPEDAVFGVVYSKFCDEYGHVEQLPILQLPQVVRTQDPNLIYSPYYRLRNKNTIIQIGPKIFSLANVDKYIGWDLFFKIIEDTYTKVKETGIVSTLDRIALRYINVFENINILEKTDFKASLGKDALINEKINFSTEILSTKSVSQLKIINSAEVVISGKKVNGSIIDIDTAVDIRDFDSFKSAIEYSHNEEKKLFYKVLGEEFTKTLNPEY